MSKGDTAEETMNVAEIIAEMHTKGLIFDDVDGETEVSVSHYGDYGCVVVAEGTKAEIVTWDRVDKFLNTERFGDPSATESDAGDFDGDPWSESTDDVQDQKDGGRSRRDRWSYNGEDPLDLFAVFAGDFFSGQAARSRKMKEDFMAQQNRNGTSVSDEVINAGLRFVTEVHRKAYEARDRRGEHPRVRDFQNLEGLGSLITDLLGPFAAPHNRDAGKGKRD